MTKATNQAPSVVVVPPPSVPLAMTPKAEIASAPQQANGGETMATKKTNAAEIRSAQDDRKQAEETSRKARAFLARTDHLIDLYSTNGAFESLIDKLVAAEDKEAEALQAEVDALKAKLEKHGQLHLLGISGAPKAKRGRKPGSTNKASSASTASADDIAAKVKTWLAANPNKGKTEILAGAGISEGDWTKLAIGKRTADFKMKGNKRSATYSIK